MEGVGSRKSDSRLSVVEKGGGICKNGLESPERDPWPLGDVPELNFSYNAFGH